jgi:ribosomal protein S18 acetylase RimI-like enzyme
MSTTARLTVRQAEERDLDALATFEVAIARASFQDDAIVDPAVHRHRLERAMARGRAGMFVAEPAPGGPIAGWLWVSLNRNFTTGAAYAQFRSLAVAPGGVGAGAAEELFRHGLAYVRAHGVGQVVGKVHVSNVPMRLVYRAFGFEAQHLTMRLTLE